MEQRANPGNGDDVPPAHRVGNAVEQIKNEEILERITRDLKSPSASVRSRALNALKDPENSPYNIFDVSHAEEDIITEEERNYEPTPLKEVLKNVILYVEMRTDDEDRTEGIKKFIAALGVNINDTLKRNTTHVLFKDGRPSTYNKAKKWGIPIVSIMWIEACKKGNTLCDPAKYPIDNLKHYEEPELYGKVKKQKFLLTGMEVEKRPKNREKAGTTTKKQKKSKAICSSMPNLTKSAQKPKKSLARPYAPPPKTFSENSKGARLTAGVSANARKSLKNNHALKAPATRRPQLKSDAKKSLNFFDDSPHQSAKNGQQQNTAAPEGSATSKDISKTDDNTDKYYDYLKDDKNVNDNQNVQSSVAGTDQSLKTDFCKLSAQMQTTSNTTITNAPDKTQETHKVVEVVSSLQFTSVQTTLRRRTTNNTVELSQFELKNEEIQSTPVINKNRRRTLYTPRRMEEETVIETQPIVKSCSKQRDPRRTVHTPQHMLEATANKREYSTAVAATGEKSACDVQMNLVKKPSRPTLYTLYTQENLNKSISLMNGGEGNNENIPNSPFQANLKENCVTEQSSSARESGSGVSSEDSADAASTNALSSMPVVRKRKLFVPNSYTFLPTPKLPRTPTRPSRKSIANVPAASSSQALDTPLKRRRTMPPLLPLSTNVSEMNAALVTKSSTERNSRPSTLDFEAVRKLPKPVARIKGGK